MVAQRPRKVALIVVVAATVAVIASDANGHLLTGFWRDHSMISAVVSGLLFIGIGVLVVDDAIGSLERRRWRRVQRVVWRSLTVSMRRLRSRLRFFMTGDDSGARVSADTSSWERVKTGARACGHLPPDHASRFRALVTNADWVTGARKLLVEEKDAGRELLARWAPLMLASGDLARELEKVARLNDELSDFERELRVMQEAGSSPSEERIDELSSRWAKLLRGVVASERAFAKLADLDDADTRGARDLSLLPA
jgi:hypothetical protein